ncbi:MAG: hypothetical protein ACYDCL_00155 [Myxococcales bacterium]
MARHTQRKRQEAARPPVAPAPAAADPRVDEQAWLLMALLALVMDG